MTAEAEPAATRLCSAVAVRTTTAEAGPAARGLPRAAGAVAARTMTAEAEPAATELPGGSAAAARPTTAEAEPAARLPRSAVAAAPPTAEAEPAATGLPRAAGAAAQWQSSAAAAAPPTAEAEPAARGLRRRLGPRHKWASRRPRRQHRRRWQRHGRPAGGARRQFAESSSFAAPRACGRGMFVAGLMAVSAGRQRFREMAARRPRSTRVSMPSRTPSVPGRTRGRMIHRLERPVQGLGDIGGRDTGIDADALAAARAAARRD